MKSEAMKKLTTLGLVLQSPHDYSWKLSVYASFDKKWSPDTECLLFDADESADDGDPEPVKDLGFERILSVQDFQMIHDNAKQQRVDASLDDLFCAFTHYYDNDAFLDFSAS